MKRLTLYILLPLFLLCRTTATAQNNPYVDDRLVHLGFSVGMNFMSFGITDSQLELEGEIYHARVSSLLPGFSVSFITDLRLSRHLSLRCTPGLQFASRKITYTAESGNKPSGSKGNNDYMNIMTIPISIPLYLKWSAEREGNYRPYLIGGGGVSYNINIKKDQPIYLKGWDYFVEVGFGCDLYFSWFKWCPELTYRIGFANQLVPIEQHDGIAQQDEFYTRAIDKVLNRALILTFNFE